jgi:hypothetical protein
MNTKINLTYKGEVYTLEYNRMGVKLLENAGFVFEEFLAKPMNNIELVFAGAFVKNHRKVSQTTIDDIFNNLRNKQGLIEMLQKMIQETYEALLEEPEEDSEGNATWEVMDLSPKKSQK